MTATNHALTGASVGLIMGDAALAIPIAFLSHYVLDALPHFGPNGNDQDWIKSKKFKTMLIADALLCLVLVAVMVILQPHNWFLACLCAFMAASPDLFWLNRFIRVHLKKPWQPSLLSKFASFIQWFQRPIGVVVEVTWAVAAIIVISNVIK